jgi:uncharacterized protein
MKLSKYNISFPYGSGRHVLYNTLVESVIVLNDDLLNIVKKNTNNICSLEQIHPELFLSFINKGFVIHKELDEYELAINKINEYNNNKDRFHLIVNPTMDCNFKCWYCYESHIKGSQMTNETLEKTKKFINKQVLKEELEKFQLSFFGGEPLLYFEEVIKPLVDHASSCTSLLNKKLSIQMTTNGLLVNEEVLSYLKQFSPTSFQVTLDGYKEDHDNTRYEKKGEGSFDIITKNIGDIIKQGHNVVLRINYTHKNIKSLDKILDSFNNLNKEERSRIMLSMNRVWQDKCHSISNEDVAFEIKAIEFGITPTPYSYLNHVKSSCYADKVNEAVINYDGSVYKCNAREFNNSNKEGNLNQNGDIEWNERHQLRIVSRFNNIPCETCIAFPLCGGGCSQTCLDKLESENYCLFNFIEKDINDYVYEVLSKWEFKKELNKD